MWWLSYFHYPKSLSERGGNIRLKNNITYTTNKNNDRRKRNMSSNDHYIVDYQKFGGIKLYKVHGFMGDYIELDNSVVERKVCSLEEARSGKHKFYEKESGREIKFDEIPWK